MAWSTNIRITNDKFGLSIYPPSVKFIQCQTVLRKALKSSPNESTNNLWKATSNHTNIQYDAYNSTKEVLKYFRSGHENKLLNQLTSQGSFFCSVTKFALPQLNKVWSIAQSQLPKNIYNFTIRYINNSLPTRKNLNRWAISSNSDCSSCLSPETLLHIVAGCQFYLDRFTWRHNSVMNFLAHTLQTVDGSLSTLIYMDSKALQYLLVIRIAQICYYCAQMVPYMWSKSLLVMRQTSKIT
jgi:hypothetical protein